MATTPQIFPGATAAAIADGHRFPFSDDPDGYSNAICARWTDKLAKAA